MFTFLSISSLVAIVGKERGRRGFAREGWLRHELILPLFPCRTVGMGRRGASLGPTPSFGGLRVTSPRQAAVFPLGPPSLRAATV